MASVDPVASSQSQFYVSSQHNEAHAASATLAYQQAEQAQLFALNDAALIGSSSSSGSGFASISNDLLDLSPEALNILNGISVEGTPVIDNNVNITVEAGGTLNTGSVTLTAQQQVQLNAILAPFAGQPFSAETLAQIQSSLSAAGISPEQVSLEEIISALGNTRQYPVFGATGAEYYSDYYDDRQAA